MLIPQSLKIIMLCKRDFLDIKTGLQEAAVIFSYRATENMSTVFFDKNE